MFATLVNLFAAPSAAYRTLQQHPSVLFPLLLLVISVGLTNFTYFSVVDPEFMMEDMLEQSAGDLTGDEREQVRKQLESIPPGAMKWASTISGSVLVTVILLIHAAYFFVLSMFTGTKIKYRPWLSFVCWSSLPGLLALIAGIVAAFIAGGDLSLRELNPLTFTNLLNFQPDNSSVQQLLDTLDVTRIWSLILMIIGYRIWTDKSWATSIASVSAPLLLIYGVWFYLVY